MRKIFAKKNKLWIGTAFCVVATFIFMFVYITINRSASRIDISSIPVLEASDDVQFYIDDVSTDAHGVMYITCAAKNDTMNYDYTNWVLGSGKKIYKNVSVILINTKKQNAYKLKTYPCSYASRNKDVNEMIANGNGIIAYADKKVYTSTDLSIAVMFEDRENNYYILYPEEAHVINENRD